MPSLEVSDLEGGLGTLVEEGEDLVVELVDPGTPIVQVHRDSCPAALSLGPRIIGSPLSPLQATRVSERGELPRGERPMGADGPKAIRRSRMTGWPRDSQ